MRKTLALAALVAVAGTAAARHAVSVPAPANAGGPVLFAEGVISTPDDEFGAAFTPDGNVVYFTKRTPTTNTSPLSFICVARRGNGRWQEPEIAAFSGAYNDLGAAVSPDGKRLYFASDRPLPGASAEKRSDLNIWFVERQGDGWGPARALGSAVNTPAEELSPSVAADGTLYFASTRPGGKGSLDLWRARPKGEDFAEPENLGDVNSRGPDGAPAISPDQSLLVFASGGRPDTLRGRGHYYPRSDLYVSEAAGAGWGPPRHLDPPINTTASESNPSLSPDGAFLYFSSDRGFAGIPMEPAVTAREFEDGVRAIANGWSNIYRIDARVLREKKATR